MSKPINKTTVNSFGGLFADCATHCEAYAVCGGNRVTVPCGCVWTDKNMRYKCEKCPIVCREKQKNGPKGLEPDFTPHLDAGSSLEQVTVRQDVKIKLPLFIPTNTHFLKADIVLSSLRWVAADIPMLFNTSSLNPHFATSSSTQEYLRVGPDCNYIAVLNGRDTFLENFWAMKRSSVLEQLHTSGFSIGTGATFSITDLTYKGTPTPFSHHVAMLMRHHRVVNEIQAAGMDAVPNIYWLDGDKRELLRWAEWLMKNNQIYMVSRDFTSTRSPKAVLNKLNELISLLNMVGRSFRVLIVGTGCKIAPLVIQELSKAGHTGSIVTSAPIQHAYRNVEYHLKSNGLIVAEKLTDQAKPFSDLMRHNMEIFETALFKATEGTEAGLLASRNLL